MLGLNSLHAWPLTLKVLTKMHLKMLNALDVGCIYLLILLTNVSIKANSIDQDQTARVGAV